MKGIIKKILLFTFRKSINSILHDSAEAMMLRQVIDMNKSATSVYIEVMEFIQADILGV